MRPKPPAGRTEAIEMLLLWEGRVSRSRLLELFDLHPTQASRDIASFRASYPKACAHDIATKTFVVSPVFRPTLTQGVFSEYQQLIGARGRSGELAACVPVESANQDATQIAPGLFRDIHRGMRDGLAIRIEYRSMTHPARHERTVRPHALIQAGTRWHVRAWCNRAQGFRDFNLGRISGVKVAPSLVLPGPDDDADWQRTIKIRFVPHCGLSSEQAQLVRDETMGGTSALVQTVRAAMVRYLIHAFRAAIDPAREKPPDHLLMVDDPAALPACTFW